MEDILIVCLILRLVFIIGVFFFNLTVICRVNVVSPEFKLYRSAFLYCSKHALQKILKKHEKLIQLLSKQQSPALCFTALFRNCYKIENRNDLRFYGDSR